MDNRLFNVNGEGLDLLTKALVLAFAQEGSKTCRSWEQSKEHGLVLSWSDKDNPFPAQLNAEQCAPFVMEWLRTDFADTVTLNDWCGDMDHDGHNGTGWQVYVDNWGHVGDNRYAICAIKPCYMWYGK